MTVEKGWKICCIPGSEAGGRGQDARSVGGLEKLEKAGNQIALLVPWKETALQAPWIGGLQASRLWGERFMWICYDSQRKHTPNSLAGIVWNSQIIKSVQYWEFPGNECLELSTLIAEAPGLIPDQGTKIPTSCMPRPAPRNPPRQKKSAQYSGERRCWETGILLSQWGLWLIRLDLT